MMIVQWAEGWKLEWEKKLEFSKQQQQLLPIVSEAVVVASNRADKPLQSETLVSNGQPGSRYTRQVRVWSNGRLIGWSVGVN